MMQKTTMTVSFTQSQLRDAAMRQSGLNPQAISMKPGTRIERDRKHAVKRGYIKHKSRCWD